MARSDSPALLWPPAGFLEAKLRHLAGLANVVSQPDLLLLGLGAVRGAEDAEVILGLSRRARLALFEKHAAWARRIALAVAKGLPPCFDADDLEQVAGAELWKLTGLWDPNRVPQVPLQGFALAAIRGACYMSVRRGEYAEKMHEEVTEGMPAPGEERPDAQAEQSEASRRVRCVLANLPAAQRRVLELHYLDGLPLTECARVMHQRPTAIYALKETAMAEMRRRLNDGAGREQAG